MARFLFTVWSFAGHLNPNISVALALRERGHDVAVYTGLRAAATLNGLGLTHFPMRHIDEERIYQRLFPPDDSAGRTASPAEVRRLRATFKAWLLGTIPGQMADLEPLLDDWQPDAMVCDPTIWSPFLVWHERRSIPVAIFSYTTGCSLSGPDAPPWGRGLPPPTTAWRRLRVAAERAAAGWLNHDFHEAASAIRARAGLAPLTASVTDFGGTMPLFLVTSVPEFDYDRRNLPPSVHYVGRCAWDRPNTQPPPAWIDDLPADRPLVYVTEGTVHGRQPRLLKAAARGLAGLPMQVLLTLNADRDPAEVGLADLAPNVWLKPYTPGQGWQSDILPRTSLIITNGGAGSVLAALASGIPQIIVPTAWDKPENAQRVVESGVGLRLSPRRLSPETVRAAAQRAIGEPRFAEQARRLQAAFSRFDGPSRAAELLETLIERRAPGPIETAAVHAV
jgi:MGT family glycosyltransferase